MFKKILIVVLTGVSFVLGNYIKRAEYKGKYSDVVIIDDINSDGNLEIYNPTFFTTDSMYLIVREYQDFQEISATYLPYYAVPWDIGDINQNGLTDIVVQSGDPGIGGNGYLRIYEQTSPNSYPDSLIVNFTLPGMKVYHHSQYTDLDQDGKIEITMSPNYLFGGGGGGTRIYEWDNNQLNLVWEYLSEDCISRRAVGDFNGNGQTEFVFCERAIREFTEVKELAEPVVPIPVQEGRAIHGMMIRIFECVGDNSYQEIYSFFYPHFASYIGASYALDFDGDGQDEFVIPVSTEVEWGYRYLVFKYQNGAYQLWYDLGESTKYFGVINTAVADFDQDGCDEFVATIMPFWIRIYDWTASGPTYFEIEDECLGSFAADFNHNGYPDFYAVIFRPYLPRHVQFWEYEPTGIVKFESEAVKEDVLKISPSIGKIFRIESLYPNEKIFIYDHSGRLVKIGRQGLVDLRHLPNGIYFVKNRSQTVKITVVK